MISAFFPALSLQRLTSTAMAAAQVEPQRPLQLPTTATPSSYFVCQDAALQQLALTTPSMPVGLLACQRDPLLRTLLTTIHSSKKVPETAAAGKNKKSNTQVEENGTSAGGEKSFSPKVADSHGIPVGFTSLDRRKKTSKWS